MEAMTKKVGAILLIFTVLVFGIPFFLSENVKAVDADHYVYGTILTSDGDLLPYDTDFRVWVLHDGAWHHFPSNGGWDPVGTMGGWYSFTLPLDEHGINWSANDFYRIQIDCTPSGGLAENATSNGTGSADDPVSPKGSYNNQLNWRSGGGINNSQRWDVVCSSVDLNPTDMTVNGLPYFPPMAVSAFSTVKISANVTNVGRTIISEPNTIVLRDGSGVVDQDTAVTIDAGSSEGPFNLQWDAPSSGDFCLNVTVDYYGNVTETNENNNSEMICISVQIADLDVTFHDLSPDTHTFSGDENVTMIWLEMTPSGGAVQVNSIDFTLGGRIEPDEVSRVILWDDYNPFWDDFDPYKAQDLFECELANSSVPTTTFTVPEKGRLNECRGPGEYVIEEFETRFILVLLSVDSTADAFLDTVRLSVSGINTHGAVNGGTGTTKDIQASTVFFSDDMESGQDGWTIEGWDEGHVFEPEGLWHLSSGEEDCENNMLGRPFYHSSNTSWWYGHRYEDPLDPGTYLCNYSTWMPGNYSSQTRNMGNLTTPTIDATEGNSLYVAFWYMIMTEPDPAEQPYDIGHLWLHDGSWHKITIEPYDNSANMWRKAVANLSEYAGKNIQLEFRFDTIDEINNAVYLGWFVDDVTVYGMIVPPIQSPTNLTTATAGEDMVLEWDASISTVLDHYIVYRAPNQREFDFSNPLYDTSSDADPLRTDWTDVGAATPGLAEEYYYVVRAVSIDDRYSTTSNTAGKWTKSFAEGLNAFSLPLQTFEEKNISWFAQMIPNVDFIRWMDSSGHWIAHYPSMGEGVNDVQAEMGKAYEISLSQEANFTFCGYPASMIGFQEGLGNSIAFRSSLSARIEGNDVNLSWEAAIGASRYLVLRNEARNGLHDLSLPPIANTTETHWIDPDVIGNENSEYYYTIIPLDSDSEMGGSTYSVGVHTVVYSGGSGTFALPLKPEETHSLDWYCDEIPNIVGMAYMIFEVWKFHARQMPLGVFDQVVQTSVGYQISISSSQSGKFTFIGW